MPIPSRVSAHARPIPVEVPVITTARMMYSLPPLVTPLRRDPTGACDSGVL
jgi:hypothetical protein